MRQIRVAWRSRITVQGSTVTVVPGRAIDRTVGTRTRGQILLNSRGAPMDRRAATVGCGTLADAANVRIAGPHPPMLGHTFVPTAAWPGDTGRSGRSARNRGLCSCTWDQIADSARVNGLFEFMWQ
jgi:hypothetical protein